MQIFKVSKIGTIAGCRVIEGSVGKNAKVKVIRNEKIIYDGDILVLKEKKMKLMKSNQVLNVELV